MFFLYLCMCLGDAAYVDGGRLCRCPGPTRVAHEGRPLKRRKVKKMEEILGFSGVFFGMVGTCNDY